MLCYLLFYLLVLPFNIAFGVPFTLNAMTQPYQKTQHISSADDTKQNLELATLSDDDDAEEKAFEEDEEEDDAYHSTFRIKAIRALRSIKKHSQLLIAALGGCTLVYLYRYKLWPFEDKTDVATQSQENMQSSTEDAQAEENTTESKIKTNTKANKNEQFVPAVDKNPTTQRDNVNIVTKNKAQQTIEKIALSNPAQSLPLVNAPEKRASAKVSTYHVQELVLPDNNNSSWKKLEENTRNFTNKYSN